ncbi:MAG: cation:proton antiporter [Hyphomonadaceae bacterium]
MMVALAAAAGVLIALALTLVRLFAGPTLYDRALAAKSAAIKLVLICAALAVAAGRADWVDAAFALLLAALVTTAAVLKFFRARTFQPPLARGEDAA